MGVSSNDIICLHICRHLTLQTKRCRYCVKIEKRDRSFTHESRPSPLSKQRSRPNPMNTQHHKALGPEGNAITNNKYGIVHDELTSSPSITRTIIPNKIRQLSVRTKNWTLCSQINCTNVRPSFFLRRTMVVVLVQQTKMKTTMVM